MVCAWQGPLSRSQLVRSRLVDHIFEEIAKDIIFQQFCVVNLNTKLLTNLPGEAEILNRISAHEGRSASVASLLARLSHEVPLFSDVPIRELVKLRAEEPTAFDQYRIALSGILGDYVGSRDGEVDNAVGKRIFVERIEPELVRLRRQHETYRKRLLRKSTALLALSGVIVTVGLSAHLTPAELAALGSGAMMGSLAGLLGEADPAPSSVQNHDLYFLLRVSQASN